MAPRKNTRQPAIGQPSGGISSIGEEQEAFTQDRQLSRVISCPIILPSILDIHVLHLSILRFAAWHVLALAQGHLTKPWTPPASSCLLCILDS